MTRLLLLLAVSLVPGYIHAQSGTGMAVRNVESFAGYNIFQCHSAVGRITGIVFNTFPETTRYTPIMLAKFPEGKEAAARCLAAGGWKPETIDPRELESLIRLAMFSDDTVTMNSASARFLSLAKTQDEQIRRLGIIIGMLIEIPPIHWKSVDAKMQQLEAIPGPNAATKAIQLLMNTSFLAVDHIIDDTVVPRLLAHAGQLAARVSPEQQADIRTATHYSRLILEMMNGDTVKRDGVPLKAKLEGQAVVGGAGPYPIPGKINIVVFDQNVAPATVAAMNRLKAEFKDTIAVIYLRKTATHFLLQGPLTFEKESQMLRDYQLDSLHAPDPMLLEKTPVGHRPFPDNRLVFGATVNETYYTLDPSLKPGFMIVDGNGIVRSLYVNSWVPYTEIRLENGIRRVLSPHT